MIDPCNVLHGWHIMPHQSWFFFTFWQIFATKKEHCSRHGDQPIEDLGRYNQKKNREVKNLGILLHVGEALEPIS